MSLFSWPVPKGRACALECLVLVGFSAWFSVGCRVLLLFFFFLSFFSFPFKESSGNFCRWECKWQCCFFVVVVVVLLLGGFALMRSPGMRVVVVVLQNAPRSQSHGWAS